ncbi:MAG: MoaD/ThiS family protein [Pyrinomonadaceae bacterium]
MPIKVLFFGATANVTGQRTETVEAGEKIAASVLFNRILSRYPQLASHRLLFSINHEYATGDEILRDGDEIAIFTAVSGG